MSAPAPSSRPLLVFDGDCGFCRRWVERWRVQLGDRLEFAPFQEVADRLPAIPREHFEQAVHLVLPDGEVLRGAAAVFRALALAPRGGVGWWLYRHVPGFRPASELAYRLVARNRVAASKVTKLLVGPDVTPARYERASWLFLRGLALVFLIAFTSLWVQLAGLIGSRGIEPAAETMQWARQAFGGVAFFKLPTVFWLGASDAALNAACAAGVGLSLLLFLGVAQRLSLFLLWLLYLSLLAVGGPFLSYQWDVLLLETGLLAIFLAPTGLWPRRAARFERPGPLFLLRWLLFRLMLLSGLVKLASGDETWWSLRALEYHFWTQPLPTWLGFYAYRLPAWLLRGATGVMFFIELGLPLFIFGTRRMRRLAAAGFVLLQVGILATGNYGFFNLLTILLCLPLLDDAFLAKAVPRWRWPRQPPPHVPAWRQVGFALFAAVVLAVSVAVAAQRLGLRRELPSALVPALEQVETFASINAYGLFAVMTTERPEIDVEGSDDGEHWRSYEFKWKPGPPERRPALVAPHQPRLDWQMWFAALEDCRSNPWFLRFQQRLLEGSEPVLKLLARNPFPDHPPRFVRSTLYRYRFTRTGEDGYWAREQVGPYCPALTLEDGQLRRAGP